MLISQDDITIRKMEDKDDDYLLMLKWLTNEILLEYYEGRDKKFTFEKIKDKYQPRILGQVKVIPCILEVENKPIGYIQFYELNSEQKKEYEVELNIKAYGIDIFIGELENSGKGLGTQVLQLLTNYLITEEKADLVTIDPKVNNPRAIRSYEKAGFKKVKILPKHELHEGEYYDNWLMIFE